MFYTRWSDHFTAVAILIHFRRDFRAQSSDFFILLRSYVWYFANNSCALNRFGSDEWQFHYLANRYLEGLAYLSILKIVVLINNVSLTRLCIAISAEE